MNTRDFQICISVPLRTPFSQNTFGRLLLNKKEWKKVFKERYIFLQYFEDLFWEGSSKKTNIEKLEILSNPSLVFACECFSNFWFLDKLWSPPTSDLI